MSGLGVGTPEEEARGGGLPGHHDHQPGHAEGQQGGLSAGQENVIQNTGLVYPLPSTTTTTSILTTRFVLQEIYFHFLKFT